MTLKSCFKLAIIVYVVCFMIGCSNTGSIQLSSEDYQVIQNYLDKGIFLNDDQGRPFCAFEVLGKGNGEIYVWSFIQYYYKGSLERGTGWSVPMVLKVERVNGKLRILDHKLPGDGNKYWEDIKKMFPESIWDEINEFSSSGKADALERQSLERAKQWKSSNWK